MKFISIIIIMFGLLSIQSTIASEDYCSVLKESLNFYKMNRAGRLPDNDIPWRGNSVLDDSYPSGTKDSNGDGNLSGGYFDAGDAVKFGLPMTYSMTILGWAFNQYQSNIEQCGLTELFLETIKYGTDWILAAHVSDNEFVAQVGDGNLDHAYWGPPETLTMSRPVYTISATAPGTEVAMEAASALAAASIAFKSSNSEYAATCLAHAKTLHNFGYTYRGVYSDSVNNAQAFYNSGSGYKDELVWGSIWLYKATGDSSYLTKAVNDYATEGVGYMSQGNAHSWDNVAAGCSLLLSQLVPETTTYLNDFNTWLNYWLPGGGVTYTPGGLAWLNQWGPARYAATSAFLASMAGTDKGTAFTSAQIAYLLGDNSAQQSFVVGVGPNYPINPHHRAAHHSTTNDINNPVNNLYLLKGALVGGPGSNDEYTDDRTDYISNEVATDYNAGFVGAIASLVNPSSSSVPTVTPSETSTENSSIQSNEGSGSSTNTHSSSNQLSSSDEGNKSSTDTQTDTSTQTGSETSPQTETGTSTQTENGATTQTGSETSTQTETGTTTQTETGASTQAGVEDQSSGTIHSHLPNLIIGIALLFITIL